MRVVVAAEAPTWAHDLETQINRALASTSVVLGAFTVATVPPPGPNKNALIVVTDGNAGARCFAISDGTAWKRIAFGATISTT